MKHDKKMIEDARELYLKYGGRQHIRIAREMREKGWPFYREMLYSRQMSHKVVLGLPEQYGWTSELTPPERLSLRRNLGRNAFEAWLTATFPEWKWNRKYQRYIYRHLAEITSGASRRLMVFMPPRHGKSETVTVRYTAWRLLQDPKLNVILGSYNQKLANRFSRKVRRLVRAGSPDQGRPKSGASAVLSSAGEWETPGGGLVRAVGVGAGVAGFGAGLIVIDDPVKNRAEAESEAFRDRVWEWFNDDIYTRMEPGAAIILIQTRWHEDDLAGRLLAEMENGGERWEVVSLAAIAEENDPIGRRPGQALCPQLFDLDAIERYRKKLGTYSFSALYQQRPAPAEGGQFKREWFAKVIASPPPGLRWKRGYDLAVSLKETADYTASFRCAKDRQGNLYIDGGFRARIEYPEQRRYIIERMAAETDTEHGIEAAVHGQAVVQDLRRERRLGRFAFRQVRVRGDKLTRALSWLNLAEEGKVFLVRGPWIDEFIDEVARFPTGRHDDQIDAVSVAVCMIAQNSGYATAMGF